MSDSTLAKELRAAFPTLPLLENEPMAARCSFRIGGPAEVFAEPESEKTLCALWRWLRAHDVPVTVVGNGTNLLVHDEGVRGVVLHLGEAFSEVRRDGERLYAGAGVTLAHLATVAKDEGLAGLEFAHGIPGSLGGAIVMNAGAYGGEMRDVVTSVCYLNKNGEIDETWEPGFGYRQSRFAGRGELVLGANFRLTPGDPAAIHERMMERWAKRSASQPLDKPSAGSTFKRPDAGYAAAYIEQAGLKGFTIGGAQVSAKHAGFVINLGSATFADVTALMAHIQDTVQEQFGVRLEPEVRII